MQKLIFVFVLVFGFFVSTRVEAQIAPTNNGIFFQAVARDNYSNPAKDRTVFVEASIIQNAANGTKVLTELFQTTTDGLGVFSISIGSGTRIGGTLTGLDKVDWANGPYYLGLKIAIKPLSPIANWDYTKELIDLGASAFGTVPYAFYSAGSASVKDQLKTTDTTKMLLPYAKKTDLALKVNLADSSTIYVTPTQLRAVKFDTTSIYNSLNQKEVITNKSTNVTTDATSDTKYPSVKAVKSYVDLQFSNFVLADGSVTTAKLTNGAVTDAKIVSVAGAKVTGDIAGNAATATLAANATKLATPRTINGVAFDGTSNITIATGSTVSDADANTKGIIQLAGDLTGTAAQPRIANGAVTDAKIVSVAGTKVTGDIAGNAATATLAANATNATNAVNATNATTATNATLAASATKLATPRTINGVAFDGTSNITIATGSTVSDADANTKGIVQLAGDLTGTAAQPTIANGAVTNAKIADVAASKITGAVAIANGGTGATTAAAARANLGLVIGTDVLAQRTFGSAANNSTSDFIAATDKGANNGVATLGNDGKIPSTQIPAISFQSASVVANQAAMLALTNQQVGSIAIRTDNNKNYVLSAVPAATLANWVELATPSSVTSVNGNAGPNVVLTAADIAGVEIASNKSNDVAADATSTTKYPTVKSIKDYVDQQSANAGVADNSITSAKINGPITIAKGGTGAITAAGARTNLGLVIGTDVMSATATTTLTGDVTGSGNGSIATTVNSVGGVSSSTIATLPTSVNANTASITANTNYISSLTTSVNANTASITAEITRATNAEAALDTRIASNIASITAEITRATNAEAALDTRITSNAASITTNTADILLRAPINSPTFTGTPTAPTPATSDNSTKVATTEYVKANLSTVSAGTLTGTTLASTITGSSLASVGTITSGTWSGSVIGSNVGGAGSVNGIMKADGTGVVTAIAAAPLIGQFLTSAAGGTYTWTSSSAVTGSYVPYTGATGPVDLGAYDLKVNGLTIGKSIGTNNELNIAFGTNALQSVTTSNQSIGIGYNALQKLTSGYGNTSVGSGALPVITTGAYNVGIGMASMYASLTPSYNVGVGNESLYGSNGNYNIGIGYRAVKMSSTVASNTGRNNIGVGYQTLFTLTSGINNTVIGNNAGNGLTSGSYNTIIGAQSGTIGANLNNNIILSDGQGTVRAQHDGTTGWTLGTIASGTWSGTTISVANGGTGLTSPGASGNILTSDGTNWVSSAPAVSGVSSLTYSSTSATNGGTISGTSLTLTAADATNPGLISTGAQTIAGDKTFNNQVTVPGILLNNGSAIWQLGAGVGSTGISLLQGGCCGRLMMDDNGRLAIGANYAPTTFQFDVQGNGRFTQDVTAPNFLGNATTATTAGNITATTNTTLTSLSNLNTVGTITSGTWSGTTIAVANGGTGASSAASALTNLGAEATVNKSTATDLGGANTSDVLFPTQKAVKSYVDAQSAAAGVSDGSITNAKLAGSITSSKLVGTDIATVGTITSGTWSGTTIAIANGGTGATTVSGAKTNLGLNNVENTALSTWTGSTNITSVGNLSAIAKTFMFQDVVLGYGVVDGGKIRTDASNKYLAFHPNYNVESTRMWPSGNVTIQTGGTFTDNGFKLEVAGTSKLTGNSSIVGNLDVTGNITSATWSGTTIPLTKGGTGATTKAAAFDALSPMTASGDLIYGGTSGTGTRLAKGTDGQILTLASGVPTWASAAASGISSIGAISATSNAKGATISGTTELILTPADATNSGIITTGSQTIAGAKTFNNDVTAPNFLGNATTATTAGNITATSNTTLTSLANLETVGTITSGTWRGSVIGSNVGGAGTVNGLLKANGSGVVSAAVAGTDYQLPLTITQSGVLSNTSGINTGDQTIDLIGDVTGRGNGTFTTTLAASGVNANSYGSSTAIPTFTVDSKGRLTTAGSANIIANAGTLTGTTLNSTVTTSSLSSVATITSGVWNGSTIGIAYGGTGTTTSTGSGSLVLSNSPTLVTPVIGAATGTSLSLTGNLSASAGTFSSTLSAGASTLASLTVNGAASVGGTLGVTGATTLSTLTASGNSTLTTLTTTGAATFSSTVSIPTGAGLNKVLVSDANGGATWNSNPNAAFRLVSSSATYTVSATDDKYVIYSNAATGTISLPAITSTMSGKEIIIKNISNFNVTISANGSQKIVADFANNAATSATLGVEASNNWVKLIADGTNNQWILFRALF